MPAHHTSSHPTDMTEITPKWLLKRLLRRFGYDIVRWRPASARPLDLLALAVRASLAAHPDFFFVQIGANDGLRNDPLRRLILANGLSGLLVEPLPDMFAALKDNYDGQHRLLFENCAISGHDGTLSLLRFRADAPVHDEFHGLATVDAARLSRFARNRCLDAYLEAIAVPCTTLSALLQKYGITKVDLLLLDVEGHEYAILHKAFADGVFPTVIYYEFLHLSARDRIATEQALVDNGYACAYREIDMLAVREPQ